jgi:hypothetical protein
MRSFVSNGCKANSRATPAFRVVGKRPLEKLALKVRAEDGAVYVVAPASCLIY